MNGQIGIAKEKEMKSKEYNAVGRALAALSGDNRDENTTESFGQDASYFRRLSRPRSRKYMEAVARYIELTERLRVLNAGGGNSLDGGQDNPAADNREAVDTVAVEAAEVVEEMMSQAAPVEWWQQDLESLKAEAVSVVQEDCQAEEQREMSQEWWTQEVKLNAVKQDNSAVLAEIRQLKAELAQVKAAIEEELPVGSGFVGYIYDSTKEATMLQWGIDTSLGRTYCSDAELVQGAQSEKEVQQWIKGDRTYNRYRDTCVFVEVFMEAVCVVYPDGSVKTNRD